MSRDIYVQDMPAGITDVADIPSDFMPEPLPCSYEEIIATIRRIAPSADFSDPEWGHIEGEGYSIEVSIKREAPVRHFAFHCHAAGLGADLVVAEILDELGLRAFDIGSESGFFEDPR